MPQRIVYVSCSPSTLARDAGILVHKAGYVMKKAGVVNMFPHTSHVESIGVFELGDKPMRPADGAAYVPADVPVTPDA
jgi:23S rRNA (uracil1939-C5)-methyltransferase